MSAADKIKFWRENPDRFVREVFNVIPDAWQDDVLKAFPVNQRLAMKAAKGPGKTALLAWLAWNFLLTRPKPKIAATSITADNLSDNLWAEMAKWQDMSPLLKQMFTWTKTRIFCNDHPETWWMSARPWSKSADANSQGQALAGLHADFILFILDESGGIPDAVMAAAEAALSSCIEGHLVQAGNPTHLAGPLYRACTSERNLWHVTEITGDPDDPKRSPRIKVEWAREQIEKYGRDNPYVLVNVFAKFPPASFSALIGPDEVKEAMKRYYRPQDYSQHARILSIDVARSGADSTVISSRQGLQMFQFEQFRGLDSTQGANIAARKWNEWDADACFIDDTGGFGSGWIDNLIRIGKAPIGIHFSERALNPKYFNKRSEMFFNFIEWIKRGGAIPECPELLQALTNTTYSFKGEALIIEPKELIKIKLGYSPDHCDSAMLTFAMPVERVTQSRNDVLAKHASSYNPLDRNYVTQDITGGINRK